MFFSVIIPIYNAENTLQRCLDSIKYQTFNDFEVLMINDGSMDSSEDLCKSYQKNDSRFRYIYQDNSGVSEARNKGIMEASGEFITFIDSDDEYLSDYLQSFYDMIINYPDCDNYWCGFKYMSDNADVNGKEVIYSDNEKISFLDRKKIMYLHEKNLEASPVNKAYRRKIIIDNKLSMRKDLSLGEDLIFNYDYLNASENGLILIINDTKYLYYCFSDESLNHKYRANLYNIYIAILEKIKECIDLWCVSKEQYDIYYLYVFYMMDIVMRNTFHQSNTLKYKEKIMYNNTILNNPIFIYAVGRCRDKINIFYRYAYRSKNYRLVRFCDKLVKFKG